MSKIECLLIWMKMGKYISTELEFYLVFAASVVKYFGGGIAGARDEDASLGTYGEWHDIARMIGEGAIWSFCFDVPQN